MSQNSCTEKIRAQALVSAIMAVILSTAMTLESRAADTQDDGQDEVTTPSFWESLGFGVALGVAYPRYRDSMVEEATVDANNVVRPSRQTQVLSPVLIEAHCFDCFIFKDKGWRNRSVSPFVAVSPGGGENGRLINGIGYGIMFGFRNAESLRKSEAIETLSDAESTAEGAKAITKDRVDQAKATIKRSRSQSYGTRTSFNVGLGIYHQFGVQQLADGIHPNQPAPSGIQDVPTKQATRTSVMVIFSFSWE